MKLFSVLGLVLAAFAPLTQAQQGQGIDYDTIHNVTSLIGTWSSGSRAVQTGAGFANPAKMSFNYPINTGVSFSFDGDGNYEVARYRFLGNGSHPTCITGVIGWAHGKYDLVSDGSLVLTPFGDGYQQVQDPCAAVSNFIETYNETELFVNWRIFRDPNDGPKLHMFQFDGAPISPQFQVSTTPNMLPTRLLRNVTRADGTQLLVKPDGTQLLVQPDGQQVPVKRSEPSGGLPTWSPSVSGIVLALAAASLLL